MADLLEPTTPVCNAGCAPPPTAAARHVATHSCPGSLRRCCGPGGRARTTGVSVPAGSRGAAGLTGACGRGSASTAVTAEDRERCRAAAARAREVYLGATGALVERELRAYADFGYRFDADPLLPLLAADVLAAATATRSRGASS